MKMFKALCAALLVMVLVLPVSAVAKDTDKAGKITSVSGQAEVKKSGGSKKFKAFKGMAIAKGDTIITGNDGKIVMDLDSDKEVTIGSKTTLTVSELVKNAKALDGKTSLSLSQGKVLIKIKKKLDGDSRFEIETPTAIMGVMGTEFVVQYENDESFIGVFSGIVSTRHGQGNQTPTIINSNEQLALDPEGEGAREELQIERLPLIALEDYWEQLQQRDEVDKALLDQVQQLLKKKQQEAAAEAGRPELKPVATTIIYNDTTSGGGGYVYPAPTPAPTPTPEPTPEPTEEPPIEEGAPELDEEEFYDNIYSHMIDNRTFKLPFTRQLAFNELDDRYPDYVRDAVSMNYSYSDIQRDAVVANIEIEGHQLVVTLEEGVPYGAWIKIVVDGGILMNKGTSDIQDGEQVFQEGGFWFETWYEPDGIGYIKAGDLQEDSTIAIHTLGYKFENSIYIVQEGQSQGDIPFHEPDHYEFLEGDNTLLITVKANFLQGLEVGSYYMHVMFEDDGPNIRIPINVQNP